MRTQLHTFCIQPRESVSLGFDFDRSHPVGTRPEMYARTVVAARCLVLGLPLEQSDVILRFFAVWTIGRAGVRDPPDHVISRKASSPRAKTWLEKGLG